MVRIYGMDVDGFREITQRDACILMGAEQAYGRLVEIFRQAEVLSKDEMLEEFKAVWEWDRKWVEEIKNSSDEELIARYAPKTGAK